ncbi:hypothetical protein BDV23DRAFT_10102 [Aspergillus alliaceus]|uniref:Uncharacterized protein n=1 Tax=Petromyces alliaceus TaxID=209559 RepID=A0A5N7BWS6_PETAA|nr:hypothetical protein BDV23DRAFT_10102 [Aspergillus alliaceus]
MDWMRSLSRGLSRSGRHRLVFIEKLCYVLCVVNRPSALLRFASTLTRRDVFISIYLGNSRRVMQCMILYFRSLLGIPSSHPVSFVYNALFPSKLCG